MKKDVEELQDFISLNYSDDMPNSPSYQLSLIDNPGWKLIASGFEGKKEIALTIDPTTEDWIHVQADEKEFKGYAGVHNLAELISASTIWLKSS